MTQTLGVIFCHDVGMSHEMSPCEDLTTAAGVGVDDECGGIGALCGVWTAQAARRSVMRTRARSLLPNRGLGTRTTITVLLNWNRVGCSIEFNGPSIIGKVFAVSSKQVSTL